jgi:hypothetical protein
MAGGGTAVELEAGDRLHLRVALSFIVHEASAIMLVVSERSRLAR